MTLLDGPDNLSDIVERALLEELCAAWVGHHGIGLRVFDRTGQLVNCPPRPAGAQTTPADMPRQAFMDFVRALQTDPLDDAPLIRCDPSDGALYVVVGLTYEGARMGRLVCGPTVNSGAEDSMPDGLQGALALLLTSIDLVCHAGYKALLTSEFHLKSITQAFDDLQIANARLKQSNTRLQETNTRLEEVDRLKSEFLATVSHELRTPLTSVIGYSEMLMEGLAGPINPEQQDYLGTIIERSESLLRLIEGILSFSRDERGDSVKWSLVNVSDAVESALSAVRPQAAKGGLLIEVAVNDGLPTISVHGERLVQTLINLLGNAVKFTPAGGLIRVSAIRTARDGVPVIRFAVSDTGVGISPEAQARIFEPFFQADSTSTREYGGTGLGLSIVKTFVDGHGGYISVESALGVGTTFSVDIPALQATS
ncbi:MAG: two-component system sensor histidine kinase BarA [Bradymonadia bacterium]|jgi:two-component system sensor histidine kinase BarA